MVGLKGRLGRITSCVAEVRGNEDIGERGRVERISRPKFVAGIVDFRTLFWELCGLKRLESVLKLMDSMAEREDIDRGEVIYVLDVGKRGRIVVIL